MGAEEAQYIKARIGLGAGSLCSLQRSDLRTSGPGEVAEEEWLRGREARRWARCLILVCGRLLELQTLICGSHRRDLHVAAMTATFLPEMMAAGRKAAAAPPEAGSLAICASSRRSYPTTSSRSLWRG